jgi:hypothetical protein
MNKLISFLKNYWGVLLVVIFTGICAFYLNNLSQNYDKQLLVKDQALESVFTEDSSLFPTLAENAAFRRVVLQKFGDSITFKIDTVTQIVVDTFYKYLPSEIEYIQVPSVENLRLKSDSAYWHRKAMALKDTVLNLRSDGAVVDFDAYTRKLDSLLLANDSLTVVIAVLEADNHELEIALADLQEQYNRNDTTLNSLYKELSDIYAQDKKIHPKLAPYLGVGMSGTRYQGQNLVLPSVNVGVGITLTRNKRKR